jgi:hypothetical protein
VPLKALEDYSIALLIECLTGNFVPPLVLHLSRCFGALCETAWPRCIFLSCTSCAVEKTFRLQSPHPLSWDCLISTASLSNPIAFGVKMSELEKAEEPTNRLSVNSRRSVQQEYERRVSNVVDILDGAEVNASGHQDQLERQYGIWSLCGLALTIDNAWVALGGSIIVASCKRLNTKQLHILKRVLTFAQTTVDRPEFCMNY